MFKPGDKVRRTVPTSTLVPKLEMGKVYVVEDAYADLITLKNTSKLFSYDSSKFVLVGQAVIDKTCRKPKNKPRE